MHCNRYPNTNEKNATEKHTVVQAKLKTNSVGVPIPVKKHFRRQSTNESDDSYDSSCFADNHDGNNHSPVTAFSRSFSSSHGGHPFNVYSMSPRSTSVMYQYYSTPKGYYQNHVPLSKSTRSNGFRRTDENASTKLRYRNCRTFSECCEGNIAGPTPAMNGVPQTLPNDVVQDPRRRAWSESDSNRRGSLAMSRMSALKKLKKKLGRTGSLRKRRDDSSTNLNHSATSMNSLEKVEEGRQLDSAPSKSASKSTELPEKILINTNLMTISLHEEDETLKTDEFSPDSRSSASSRDRTRSLSNESVFNHDGDLIYQRFLEEHTCYDIMPTSCKLIVFDTRLQARKAFHALVANSVRAAPLWDSQLSCYVGMLTVTDFIQVILKTHRVKKHGVESVEEQTIQSWRNLLNQESSFASVRPDHTLLHSLNVLFSENFHGVPIMDDKSGDIFHIINHKRILRFLYLFMNELPKPSYLNRTLSELQIGRYDNIPTITKCDTILDALDLLTKNRLSAIPVVDDNGEVVDLFCKLDMISLAAQGLYHDLSMTMEIALAYRFTPLLEEDDSMADVCERVSPKQERRESCKSSLSSDLSTHLNEYNKRADVYTRSAHSSIRGHPIIRSKPVRPHSQTHEASGVEHSTEDDNPAEENENLTSKQRIRHISMSNSLVKCRSSDKLQNVIDLMATTDANLLVVIGQSSNHVIGIVTVADVLNYIITPPNQSVSSVTSPVRGLRRSRPRLSSSTTTSLPSVRDEPEHSPDEEVSTAHSWHSNGFSRGKRYQSKHSTSSDTSSANDSGYSSASKLNKDLGSIPDNSNHENSSFRALRRGIEIERA